jgi:hypothetical protein
VAAFAAARNECKDEPTRKRRRESGKVEGSAADVTLASEVRAYAG